MFTGIVQAKGRVLVKKHTKAGQRLEIEVPNSFNKNLKEGASVSVNGVCLTVIEYSESRKVYKGSSPCKDG